MDLSHLVAAFLREVEVCLALLRLDFATVERRPLVVEGGSVVRGGLRALPQGGGDGVRSGVVGDGIQFSLHGNGCSFELPSGAEVNVDWDANGHPLFDVWRLNSYARSMNQPAEWTSEELDHEGERLVRQGVLARRENFYVALHIR